MLVTKAAKTTTTAAVQEQEEISEKSAAAKETKKEAEDNIEAFMGWENDKKPEEGKGGWEPEPEIK